MSSLYTIPVYVGDYTDGNGLAYRLYINRITGVTYRAYDFEILRRREADRLKRQPVNDPGQGYHKKLKR